MDHTRIFRVGISEQITIRYCFLRIESEEMKSGDNGHLGKIWPGDRATPNHPGPMCLDYPGSPQAKPSGVTPFSHATPSIPNTFLVFSLSKCYYPSPRAESTC